MLHTRLRTGQRRPGAFVGWDRQRHQRGRGDLQGRVREGLEAFERGDEAGFSASLRDRR